MSQVNSPKATGLDATGGGGVVPRMILVDDNIRDSGGHYYELAYLLLAGAEQLGYRCLLATNRDFEPNRIAARDWEVHHVFGSRRLVRWSLGVDGHSRCQRDLDGKPICRSPIEKQAIRLTDWFGPAEKRPTRMLSRWADDLARLLGKVQPTRSDCLLVNTGDDFALLALARAMRQATIPPIRIDVLFHFALYESGQPDRADRLRLMGRQIRAAMDSLRPHDVYLHATTDSLADQLRELECGYPIRSVPYPTRPCDPASGSGSEPLRAIIAGMPRAEKGKDAMTAVLGGVEGLLKAGRYRLSMQLPADRWRAIVPPSLQRIGEESMPGESTRALEIITRNLDTETYHRWLSMADVGLFLYEPARYVARCSGVLLEMLARGIPVIVPDGCWLASQVRLAGGHRSIGFIYQDRAEIPDLMRQLAKRREEIQSRAKAYAMKIAERHNGRNSLLSMGIEAAGQRQQAA
mgnify:CR=1 FL=1